MSVQKLACFLLGFQRKPSLHLQVFFWAPFSFFFHVVAAVQQSREANSDQDETAQDADLILPLRDCMA